MKFTAEVSPITTHEKSVGYRPNICYAGHDSELFSVAVTGMEGAVWEFYCFIAESVERVHRHRLKPGAQFTIQEGPNVMGHGIVVSIAER